MKRRTAALAVLAIVGALTVLVGCTAVSHVSAELSGDSVKFAFCGSLRPTDVKVQVAPTTKGGLRYSDAWEVSGSSQLKKAQTVYFGMPPSGFSTVIQPKKFVPSRSTIDVLFEDTKGANAGDSLQAVFHGDKLSNDKWLNWNGKLVSEPCDD